MNESQRNDSINYSHRTVSKEPLSDIKKPNEDTNNDNYDDDEDGCVSDSTNSDRKRIRLIQDHITSTST